MIRQPECCRDSCPTKDTSLGQIPCQEELSASVLAWQMMSCNSAAACFDATALRVCLAPGAGEGHTSMRSKLASRQLTAQRLGMPIIRNASLPQALLRASAAQTGNCGQHEMQTGVYRALRQSARLATPSSILRRGVTAVPCARTHASIFAGFARLLRQCSRGFLSVTGCFSVPTPSYVHHILAIFCVICNRMERSIKRTTCMLADKGI